MNTLELQKMANEVRKSIVTAVHSAKSGHPGGSLSAADVFTYLYFEEMNIDPKNPNKPDQRPLRAFQGTYGSGLLFRSGPQRLFPGGGSADPASRRLPSAGTSLHAAHPGRRYVLRFSGTGHLRGCGHGTVRKDEQ